VRVSLLRTNQDGAPPDSNRLEPGGLDLDLDMSRSADFIQQALAVGSFSFDVEHEPHLNLYDDNFELLGVGFGTKDMVFFERDMGEVKTIIDALFPTPTEAIAYFGKYDLRALTSIGLTDTYRYPKNFCDPMVEVNLLDENRQPGEMGLKVVIYDQYGYQMETYQQAIAHGGTSAAFDKYACDDARWEWQLHTDLKSQLVDQDLWRLFTKILMPMSLLAADMEWTGVLWDIPGAKRLLRGFQEFRRDIKAEILSEVGDLNLDSGDQVAKRLFDELGYSTRGIEMTPSGKRYSTDAKAMEKLRKRYPVCEKIVRYRTANKMISTYVEPLTRMALEDRNGRVHPTIHLTSTTGRSRMEKPNFQNIPAWLDKSFAHLNLRKNIVAAPGWKLIVADLSQIELRLCGHVTQDPEFLRAYRQWQCTSCGATGMENQQILHVCPECGCVENEGILKDPQGVEGFWHGLDLHQMTTDAVTALGGSRQHGKTCNFALIYMASAMRLHFEYPQFSIRQWEEIIYQYFAKYQGVRRWHIRMEQLLYNGGTITDIFGRRRRIPKRAIHANAKHALNMFVNFPVQAPACEYIELCMTQIREQCIQMGTWMREIYQSNFVHDEGVWEVPEHLVDKYVPIIVDRMENAVRFSVPIRTDVVIADRWGDAK